MRVYFIIEKKENQSHVYFFHSGKLKKIIGVYQQTLKNNNIDALFDI